MQVSQNLFEWPTSTGIGLFAHLSFNFQKTWANHLSNTKDTSLSHTNLVTSKHIKREESSFLVDVLHSKKLLLELPIKKNPNQMPGKHPQVFQSLNFPFDAKKRTFSQPMAKTNEAQWQSTLQHSIRRKKSTKCSVAFPVW